MSTQTFLLASFLLAFVLFDDLPITLALSSSSFQAQTKYNDVSQFKNKIIACASTKELTLAVEFCVKPHYRVAELGSQLREVSTQICESCASATLVDVQRKFPKTPPAVSDDGATISKQKQRTAAMRLQSGKEDIFFPEISTFREIKKLQDWREAFFPSLSEPSSYDVLVLDVNAIVGNDLEWTSLSLIQEFQNQQSNKDLIILVKSLGLSQFASRLVYGKRYTKDYNAIPPPHILATVGVQEYRDTIPHVVIKPDSDAILEVGCHFGTTTALLEQAGKYCIGVDVGSKIIKQAKNKYPDVFFVVGDAWKTASLLRIQQEYYKQEKQSHINYNNDDGPAAAATENGTRVGFDVVFVDVGGLSGSDGLLEAILLVTSIQNALEPRCIVIKSLCMQRLSTTLVSFWELRKRMKQTAE